MVGKDEDRTEPSLELPSFGRGRRRRKRGENDTATATAPQEPTTVEAEPIALDLPPTAPAQPPLPADSTDTSADSTGIAADSTQIAADSAGIVADSAGIVADSAMPTPVPAPAPAPVGATAAEVPAYPTEQPARRGFRLPPVAGPAAAALTGLVVGALVVALSSGALAVCDVVRGTSSCGDAGFFVLVAILVVATVLGSALLRAWAVPDPGSTSLLAVGLLAVIALLFLVEVIFSIAMVAVIPLAAVASYSLSHWITTTFVDATEDDEEQIPLR